MTITRRRTLASTLGLVSLGASRSALGQSGDRRQVELVEEFDRGLAGFAADARLIDYMRQQNDVFLALDAGEERAPIRATPSKTPISKRAADLIVACEVSSKAQYEASYKHPTWPKGRSGVTIGIGYDIGYVTVSELHDDWHDYMSDTAIDTLAPACGEKGDTANDILGQVASVTIEWSAAERQFAERMQPRYVGITERALSNSEQLSSDSLGALVSLVYNRGVSFNVSPDKDKDGRYREMRNIAAHMKGREFNLIPAEIRAMKRLWVGVPDMRGVVIRRDLEATLFELGLKP